MIVAVYHDVEKYRVGKKLVEPSGTRADRPGLRAMLADARAGKFDVMLAWREDRLYRSYRPMLDVLDCLEETGLDIELAKEHFDKNLAPVKAWAARMELQAKHDRFIMGVGARLQQGRAWQAITPYGYTIENDRYVVNDDEAQWVELIWKQFGEGVGVDKIRKNLIAGGAKQRHNGDNKYAWSGGVIRNLLDHDFYYTGIFTVTWGGEKYELSVPVIIDIATAQRAQERSARYKKYPAGNLKAQTLAAGLVYCKACGTMMRVASFGYGKYRYIRYSCRNQCDRTSLPGCAKGVVVHRLDDEVWGKLWDLISVPGELEAAIEKRVKELQAQEFDATAECEKLQKKLDDLALMRQEAIAWAQAKIITQSDLELRLTSLGFEQTEAERELRDKSLLVGNRAERLMVVARAYREGVVGGAVDVTKAPETPEEAARLFQFKKKMVEGLVKRVDVKADKSTDVTFELDFSAAMAAEDLCISSTPT